MVRTKDGDGIKSNLIVAEVQKRPCLFDSNHPQYGDRGEKARCWEEVCDGIVPGWSLLSLADKFAAGKDIQKRWRSIRDSFTKAFRQGKCLLPENCPSNSKRYLYHRQMSFLLRALQNRKPRYSVDRCDNPSESNSPPHVPIEDFLSKLNTEMHMTVPAKDLDLNMKQETIQKETQDKGNQASVKAEQKNPPLEMKIDANSILPDDYFEDDKLFMHSLLPLFKKMDDDTRLMCRIEVLKIIRVALQKRMGQVVDVATKHEDLLASTPRESSLSMTTRSADGSRPMRKRKSRSPSPMQPVPKKRGPGRPRKIKPETSEESMTKKKPLPYMEPGISELEQQLSTVSSVAQLETRLFMKMYNLERAKVNTASAKMSIKTEPLDYADDYRN